MSRGSVFGLEVAAEDDWRVRAACRTEDPNLFHPDDGTRGVKTYELARQVCNRCEVRRPCLEFALRLQESIGRDFGMFGGTTPDERDQIRRCKDGACNHPRHRRRT